MSVAGYDEGRTVGAFQGDVSVAVGATRGNLLALVVIGGDFRTRHRLGIGNAEHEDIGSVVSTHLGGDGEVGDHDVLADVHIVIIGKGKRVVPVSFIIVILEVVGLSVPVLRFQILVFEGELLRFFGGEGEVGGAEVEDQLIHVTGFHVDIVGKDDREGLPLFRVG